VADALHEIGGPEALALLWLTINGPPANVRASAKQHIDQMSLGATWRPALKDKARYRPTHLT